MRFRIVQVDVDNAHGFLFVLYGAGCALGNLSKLPFPLSFSPVFIKLNALKECKVCKNKISLFSSQIQPNRKMR